MKRPVQSAAELFPVSTALRSLAPGASVNMVEAAYKFAEKYRNIAKNFDTFDMKLNNERYLPNMLRDRIARNIMLSVQLEADWFHDNNETVASDPDVVVIVRTKFCSSCQHPIPVQHKTCPICRRPS